MHVGVQRPIRNMNSSESSCCNLGQRVANAPALLQALDWRLFNESQVLARTDAAVIRTYVSAF